VIAVMRRGPGSERIRRGRIALALSSVALLGLVGCTGSHHTAAAGSTPAGAGTSGLSGASGSSGPAPSDGAATTGTPPTPGPSGSPSTANPSVAEGQTQGVGPTCQITSPASVASAFGGKVANTAVSTSSLGHPLCIFTLSSSNVGGGGVVTMTLDAHSSRAQFTSVQKSVGGQAVTGLADGAFYVSNTSTMQFLRGNTSVVVQATMKAQAGTKFAAAIQHNITTVSKVIAAQI
jgi:hypothetical protein